VFTIDQWVQTWYGLLLRTDWPEWRLMSAAGQPAAAHAAGFIAALDLTNLDLITQLAPTHQAPIDSPVRWLATARDAAWQCITALAAQAHHLGCTSLPTGPNSDWTPVCVRSDEVGPKLYPALANDAEPNEPPRFTRTTAERISDDLARQSERRVIVRFDGPLITVIRTGPAIQQPSQYAPDNDGLYQLGSASLNWQRVQR
jgi:hypothetical protein